MMEGKKTDIVPFGSGSQGVEEKVSEEKKVTEDPVEVQRKSKQLEQSLEDFVSMLDKVLKSKTKFEIPPPALSIGAKPSSDSMSGQSESGKVSDSNEVISQSETEKQTVVSCDTKDQSESVKETCDASGVEGGEMTESCDNENCGTKVCSEDTRETSTFGFGEVESESRKQTEGNIEEDDELMEIDVENDVMSPVSQSESRGNDESESRGNEESESRGKDEIAANTQNESSECQMSTGADVTSGIEGENRTENQSESREKDSMSRRESESEGRRKRDEVDGSETTCSEDLRGRCGEQAVATDTESGNGLKTEEKMANIADSCIDSNTEVVKGDCKEILCCDNEVSKPERVALETDNINQSCDSKDSIEISRSGCEENETSSVAVEMKSDVHSDNEIKQSLVSMDTDNCDQLNINNSLKEDDTDISEGQPFLSDFSQLAASNTNQSCCVLTDQSESKSHEDEKVNRTNYPSHTDLCSDSNSSIQSESTVSVKSNSTVSVKSDSMNNLFDQSDGSFQDSKLGEITPTKPGKGHVRFLDGLLNPSQSRDFPKDFNAVIQKMELSMYTTVVSNYVV